MTLNHDYLILFIIIFAAITTITSLYVILKIPLRKRAKALSHKKAKEKTTQSLPSEEEVLPISDKKDDFLTKDSFTPKQEEDWFSSLRNGLKKTQDELFKGLKEFFLAEDKKEKRDQFLDNLFEALIRADVGVTTAKYLKEKVKEQIQGNSQFEFEDLKNILRHEMLSILKKAPPLREEKPYVALIVGVNGVGKTTTVGKIAYGFAQAGSKVVIGAADTFRAAANAQLEVWAQRGGDAITFIGSQHGADPASVAYRAVEIATNNNSDLCLIDTAGRLQNRQDLMEELAKIKRVISKAKNDAPHDIFLVIDGTTGQNALQQAKMFKEIISVTGLIVTKLDGTAKGGVVLAISKELDIPIRYIGVGERAEDLRPFVPEEFVSALIPS